MLDVPNFEKTLHPGIDYALAPVAPDIPDVPTSTPENIKVLVRIRPLLPQETGPVAIVGQEGNVIQVNGATANRQLRCHYDAAIGPEVCQDGMFAHVHDCTSAVLRGENATVFAYGQTGSGKTYTMFGPEGGADGIDLPGHGKGVIPLAVADLFTGLMGDGKHDAGDFFVWVSLVQIYNEQLYDMLRDPQRVHPLAIHEQPEAGIYVQGLSEYAVHSAGECLRLLRVGCAHRAIRETHMNIASSRSHSIFQIVVEQTRRSEQDGGRVLRSKFNLVDLAGSEKWNVKQDMEDVRVSEMTNINVSLHTLGRVIAALSTATSSKDGVSEQGRQPHVPYRDSKLTRLLQDSLGGNTRTRIIATLSPAKECLDESISTLRFADRAKQVMASVRVNEHRPVDRALVLRLQAEIKHLRRLLRDIRENRKPGDDGSDGPSRSAATMALTEAQLLGYRQEIDQLRRENTALREKALTAVAAETSRVQNSSERTGPPDVAALQASNRILEESIAQMVANLRRFFRFEIEEEDLRADISNALARASGRSHGDVCWDDPDRSTSPLRYSASPLGFPATVLEKVGSSDAKHGLTPPPSVRSGATNHKPLLSSVTSPSITRSNGFHPNRVQQDQHVSLTGNQISLPPVPGASADRELKSERLAYRLRGKHPDEVVVVMKEELTEEAEGRRLRKELKFAKERMKKNLQLQEWLLQKEQKEMEELACEDARRNEMERHRRRRDYEFRRRGAMQKAKLKRFYESAQAESTKEAELRDHTFVQSLGKKEAFQSLDDAGDTKKEAEQRSA